MVRVEYKNIITDDCTRNTKMGIRNLDCGKLRKEVRGENTECKLQRVYPEQQRVSEGQHIVIVHS